MSLSDAPAWALSFAAKVMALVHDAREKGGDPDTCLVHPSLWPKEMGDVTTLELDFGTRVNVSPHAYVPEGMCVLYESDPEGRRSATPKVWTDASPSVVQRRTT